MTRPRLNTSSTRRHTRGTTRRRWNDLAGPIREVVHIFEREGARGGPYWRLVLECGHSVARKRHDPRSFSTIAQVVLEEAPGTAGAPHHDLGPDRKPCRERPGTKEPQPRIPGEWCGCLRRCRGCRAGCRALKLPRSRAPAPPRRVPLRVIKVRARLVERHAPRAARNRDAPVAAHPERSVAHAAPHGTLSPPNSLMRTAGSCRSHPDPQ